MTDTLHARIHEYLRGEADYDPRKLLREVVAPTSEAIETGGCAPPVHAVVRQACHCPEHGSWIHADDVKRLVREIDVALNGEEGAAEQASLCDVAGQLKRVARDRGCPVLSEAPTRPSLVPGVMRCAKCNLRLIRTNLCISSGKVTAGGNDPEGCPNGCGPLWPVTWEEDARSAQQLLDEIYLGVVGDVIRERQAQEAKWGQQNHPWLDPVLLGREGGASPDRMSKEYEIPTEWRAKFLCEEAFKNGHGTYGHILVEEVAEAIAEQDEAKARIELIQVAAVAIAAVEAIDRRKGAE